MKLYNFYIERDNDNSPTFRDVECVKCSLIEGDHGKVYLTDKDGVFPPSWVFGEEVDDNEPPIELFDKRVRVFSHDPEAEKLIASFENAERRAGLSAFDLFCEDDERFQDYSNDTGFHLHFLSEIRVNGKWVVGKDQKGKILKPLAVAKYGADPVGDGYSILFTETERLYLKAILGKEDNVKKEYNEAF